MGDGLEGGDDMEDTSKGRFPVLKETFQTISKKYSDQFQGCANAENLYDYTLRDTFGTLS